MLTNQLTLRYIVCFAFAFPWPFSKRNCRRAFHVTGIWPTNVNIYTYDPWHPMKWQLRSYNIVSPMGLKARQTYRFFFKSNIFYYKWWTWMILILFIIAMILIPLIMPLDIDALKNSHNNDKDKFVNLEEVI